jgi:hypothetical protein
VVLPKGVTSRRKEKPFPGTVSASSVTPPPALPAQGSPPEVPSLASNRSCDPIDPIGPIDPEDVGSFGAPVNGERKAEGRIRPTFATSPVPALVPSVDQSS